MTNDYKPFFAALKKAPSLTKEEAVYEFTNGAHTSLRKLTTWELQELTRRLQTLTPGPSTEKRRELPGGEKADKMRKAILAIFYSMQRSATDAKSWAENQGVRGIKKKFNEYTTGELYTLISIAEKIKQDFEKGLRRSA